MTDRNKKYQETEFQLAAVMGAVNLIVFALAFAALGSMFRLAVRASDFFDALGFDAPL